ncbi:MAG: epoxyqueuosine reductase [Intestinibacillus sp.]
MNILHSLRKIPGVSAAGVCTFAALLPRMSDQSRSWAEKLCPGAKSALFSLFPYNSGETSGNLSRYARGMDYHAVIASALSCFILQVQPAYPANRFVILTDHSPLPETYGAYLCGAGLLGDNGLIFDDLYGSYVFIGSILTDLQIDPTPGERQCLHCGMCRRACPSGALGEDGTVDQNRCLSALTQQGGELQPKEAAAVSNAPLIWGCDICSEVCPLNRGVPLTPNPAFMENRILSLESDDLAGLNRRQFHEKYPERAFTWRGPAPLRRNLTLHEKRQKEP